MNLTEINLREKNFHNNLQSQKKGRFENIFYKAIINAWEDFYKYLKLNANNSEILDYGCGVGPIIEKVIDYNPKKIVGIDISDISISSFFAASITGLELFCSTIKILGFRSFK